EPELGHNSSVAHLAMLGETVAQAESPTSMSYFDDPVASVSTADAPAFPPRVRSLLAQLQDLAGKELERELERLLDTLETDLFRQAQQSRNSGTQSGCLASLSTLRANRHKLVTRFAAEFATALETLRAPHLIADEP